MKNIVKINRAERIVVEGVKKRKITITKYYKHTEKEDKYESL